MTDGAASQTAARWTVALALAAILLATLTPSVSLVPPAGPWCIICGDTGTVDMLQNIVLYVPLGIGLALMRVGTRRAILAAFALTTVIELLQYFVIPGRDGALGDVLMNTLGAGVGVGLVAWRVNPLAPTPRVAAWMRNGSVAAWTAIALLGTFGMRARTVSALYSVADAPPPSLGGPTDLRVLRVWVDSHPVPPARAGKLPLVTRDLDAVHSTMAVDLATVGPRTVPQRLLWLASRVGPLFRFVQAGNAFSCTRRIVATGLRFRTPSITVDAPVTDSAAWIAGDDAPVHLLCARDPGQLSLDVSFEDRRAHKSIRLTPGSSWMLVLPGFLIDGREGTREVTSVCWLVLLALALGFCTQLPSRLATERTRRPSMSIARAMAVPLALVVIMQSVVPRPAGTAPSPWWEILASVAGLALGAAIAVRFVPRGRNLSSAE